MSRAPDRQQFVLQGLLSEANMTMINELPIERLVVGSLYPLWWEYSSKCAGHQHYSSKATPKPVLKIDYH